MQRTLAVAANRSLFNMLNFYRFHAGQFAVEFYEVNFSGDDVVSFLQNQSTYDIKLIPAGFFQLISFLDPQGRVECYGWLTHQQSFHFLIPKTILEKTISRLNKFLISEDVTISDPVLKKIFFLIGPEAQRFAHQSSLTGKVFDEVAFIQESNAPELKSLTNQEVETWRGLSGFPSFDGSDYSFSIINNLRLFDLSLVQNKGCYPGQETVSKIATRRGAAYSPVLIELSLEALAGEITSFDKKIGTALACYFWENKFYLSADLLRDFRVENMKIHFSLNDKQYDGIVKYYPLISGDSVLKSRELYYAASDYFKNEDLEKAEANYRMAIKLDPTFGDAYESLGVMLGRLNRFQEAIDLMAQLSEVDPKSVLAHTNMSLFLMKLGKIPEAEEQKSLATVKSFQSFGDEAKNKEATLELKKKQEAEWVQRESMFKQVLEIDPEDTLANYGLGSIAVEKGDWQLARNHLEKVLAQDPKYSVAYLALGKALKGLGLKDQAKVIWQEGIKVSAAKGDLMPANQMQQELNF
jgi:folate-binding Fe-S cluster repair protein YgfZ/Tfp pilus assembly protein PilF